MVLPLYQSVNTHSIVSVSISSFTTSFVVFFQRSFRFPYSSCHLLPRIYHWRWCKMIDTTVALCESCFPQVYLVVVGSLSENFLKHFKYLLSFSLSWENYIVSITSCHRSTNFCEFVPGPWIILHLPFQLRIWGPISA